ncbi:hypothetical protein Lfu02_45540 [Longispora fulva]|uniref:PknH-like extracellular domain-containing protein n=1 Tax=Longispora fulva TaxID=619741 RepID=A0A8J7KKC8_9ACTN|nr:hypothetical protein [Longispora fulva]MBG6137929.1 hypothetical protein [Longispora fulva]GIG60182.1 hypothetical protein Lfu02_45540 [Longispora fulva]
MSENLTDALGGLAHDTESVLMPGAAAIRRRGTRRTRRTAIAAGVAVLALVGGVAFGVTSFSGGNAQVPTPPGTSVAPSPSASPTPTPTASPTPSVDTSWIPDAAMLRVADLKLGSAAAGIDPKPIDEYGAMDLAMCAGGLPSSAQVARARRDSGHASLPDALERQGQGTVTSVQERVLVHAQGGSVAFMAEVRDQVGRCPGDAASTSGAWRNLGSAGLGDESVVLSNTRQVRPIPSMPAVEQRTYAVVVRIGDVVVIVADLGWESGSGHEQVTRQLAKVAVQRAGVLR